MNEEAAVNPQSEIRNPQSGDPVTIRLEDVGRIKVKRAHHCACQSIEIDEYERTVFCRSCGRRLDAFDFLLQWAKTGNAYAEKGEQLKQQAIDLGHKIEAAKQKLKNLKRQIKRAEGEGFTAEDAENAEKKGGGM